MKENKGERKENWVVFILPRGSRRDDEAIVLSFCSQWSFGFWMWITKSAAIYMGGGVSNKMA